MFCKNCGKEVSQEANFCKNCGDSTKELIVESLNSTNKSVVSEKKLVPELTEDGISKYRGIHGWLIVVVLGLFITTGYVGFQFLDIFFGSVQYGENTGLFVYDFLSMGSVTVLSIYVIYLFFTKKRKFPKYYISLLILLMVVNIITLIVVSSYSVTGSDLAEYSNNAGRATVQAIVWGLYATKSRRVKATFVEN